MTKTNIEAAVYASALIVTMGVFLPLTNLSFYGGVSYNKIASIESYLVILGVSRKISTPHQVGVGSMWTNHLGKAGHRTHRRSNAAIALWVKRWPV